MIRSVREQYKRVSPGTNAEELKMQLLQSQRQSECLATQLMAILGDKKEDLVESQVL